MIEKEMKQVKVFTFKDGNIAISQPTTAGQDDLVVIIHSDQVDTLIKWLNEAKSELQKKH